MPANGSGNLCCDNLGCGFVWMDWIDTAYLISRVSYVLFVLTPNSCCSCPPLLHFDDHCVYMYVCI